LWWLPLGVEDGEKKYESHNYVVSKVVREHPDWLILDRNGKHARMTRNLATLCPAVPEVQAYYKQLTEKFIRDWGFDGSKLDNIFSVAQCYNPAHHHKSPQDSVNAMGEVYKTIFETTRALKPESVTQAFRAGRRHRWRGCRSLIRRLRPIRWARSRCGVGSKCTKRCSGRRLRYMETMSNFRR